MEQVKQSQAVIDKFLKDLDEVNKEFESLYNSKITFKDKEARDKYDLLHDEIQKKQQAIFDNFKKNNY